MNEPQFGQLPNSPMRSCFAQKDPMIVYRLDLLEASGACIVSACARTLSIPFASHTGL